MLDECPQLDVGCTVVACFPQRPEANAQVDGVMNCKWQVAQSVSNK